MPDDGLLNAARYLELVRQSARQFRYPPDSQNPRPLVECLRDHLVAASVLAQRLENLPGGAFGPLAAFARRAAVTALDLDFALGPWEHGASGE